MSGAGGMGARAVIRKANLTMTIYWTVFGNLSVDSKSDLEDQYRIRRTSKLDFFFVFGVSRESESGRGLGIKYLFATYRT